MKFLVGLLFVLLLNTFLYGQQLAINDIANQTGNTAPLIMNVNGTPIDILSHGQHVAPTDAGELIPDASASGLSSGLGFLFPLQVAINWLQTKLAPVLSFITAVPTFLTGMGMPEAWVWMLGIIWYVICIVLVVLVALGHY